MRILAPYPDEQLLLLDLLCQPIDNGLDPYGAGAYGGVDGLDDLAGGTVLPDDLDSRLPFIQVRRLTAADTDRVSNVANVDVVVYAAEYSVGMPLARDIQQRILALPYADPDQDAVLDIGRTITGPHERPYSSSVRQFPATYRISARR